MRIAESFERLLRAIQPPMHAGRQRREQPTHERIGEGAIQPLGSELNGTRSNSSDTGMRKRSRPFLISKALATLVPSPKSCDSKQSPSPKSIWSWSGGVAVGEISSNFPLDDDDDDGPPFRRR